MGSNMKPRGPFNPSAPVTILLTVVGFAAVYALAGVAVLIAQWFS